AFGETLARELVPGHEAQSLREAGGSRGDLVEHGDDLEVEAARIDLADVGKDRPDPEMGGEAMLQFEDFAGVAVEEAELVELSADRALQSAHRVARDERIEAASRMEQLLAKHREALPVGRELRRHVVGAGGEDE